MIVGKALALTAVSGMIAGLTACASGPKPDASAPSTTNVAPSADRNCCKGKNACRERSGCKTETNASCAGKNACAGKGTSCPKA